MPGMKFTMTVSAYDCTGCGSCANVCPGKKGEKALVMENMEANAGKQEYFDFGREIPVKPEVVAKFKETTVKAVSYTHLDVYKRQVYIGGRFYKIRGTDERDRAGRSTVHSF